MITTETLSDARYVRHGFFTREGGVSSGIYASLNCGFGSNDDNAAVAENRRRAAAALELEANRLVTLYQVHSPDVVRVEKPWAPGERPKADAMVTDRPGIALGILTADCAPVLFADTDGKVVGAAHAGWRGALAGVCDAVVTAMEELGARRGAIQAAIGPNIGAESYEVGPEFRDAFTGEDTANARYFRDGAHGDRLMFDLSGYLEDRIGKLGVASVTRTGGDTCAEPDRFFSYRRSCHRGEADYARLLSAIAIER